MKELENHVDIRGTQPKSRARGRAAALLMKSSRPADSKLLADRRGVHFGHRRRWRVIQHFILFLEDQGYSATTASRFSAVLLASSVRARAGWLRGRSILKEEHHGGVLFFAWCVALFAWPRSSTKCAVVICADFWFLDGRGLHADSIGYRGVLRHRLTG